MSYYPPSLIPYVCLSEFRIPLLHTPITGIHLFSLISYRVLNPAAHHCHGV